MTGRKVIHVGGVHRVGKGTVCKAACDELKLPHLVASSLIREESERSGHVTPPISSDKRASDVDNNQRLMLQGLDRVTEDGKNYILDGHYVVYDRDQAFNRISIEVFREMNPIALACLTAPAETIAERARKESIEGSVEYWAEMQSMETEHAKEISDALGIQLFKAESTEIEGFTEFVREAFGNS